MKAWKEHFDTHKCEQMKVAYRLFLTLPLAAVLAACATRTPELEVKAIQHQVPVLVNKQNNPTLQLQLVPAEEIHVNRVSVRLESTGNLKDVQAVRLFSTGKGEGFDSKTQFGSDQAASPVIVFEDQLTVRDTSYLWLSIQLREKVDLMQKVSVSCESIGTTEGAVAVASAASNPLRLGVALRTHMDDSVDTYRIPGLTTTNSGTLLAIYDVRRDSPRDLQGNIDVGLSRSTDGGNTWEPMRIALDMGEWGGLPQKFNGVGDANILVDRSNNTAFVAGLWMYGVLDKNGKWIEDLTEQSDAWNHQWKNKGSQPGFGVKQTSQFIMTKSVDDGRTWSEPVNLTKMLKKEAWWLFAPAPGHGITLEDGTLVMPTQGRDEKGLPFSNISWSKDGGTTWRASEPAYHNTTECMAAQMSDGSIMLNMRHNANRGDTTASNGRAVSVTRDLGKTWIEHATSRNALIEPTCMGSLHRHEYTENGHKKSVLLFSNPDSRTTRNRITIKVSLDDGNTWPEERWILLDERKSRGYSCVTSIDENTIGILYEGGGADMTFQKIALSELLGAERDGL